MASLSSITVNSTLNLDPELRKLPAINEKISNVHYPKNQGSTQLEAGTEKKKKILDFREALSMIKEGGEVESSFYVPLLQECVDRNSAFNAQVVHAHILKSGTHSDVFVMTSLVNVYAKCGLMEDAQKLFEGLPERNVVTWTALMTGYVHNSQPEEAIRVFIQMLDVGAYPSTYTFGTIISACSTLMLVNLGRQIHGYIVKYGVEHETSIGNTLCSFYSKCGILEFVFSVFRRIEEKNVISWTTVISACGEYGQATMGLKYFTRMINDGVEVNEFTLTSILSLCCGIQALEVGTQIHAMSIKLGYHWSLLTQNSIMYLYLKCGFMDEARRLFGGMDAVGLVTWNAMISGHAQAMNVARDDVSAYHTGKDALSIYLKMNRSENRPDSFTFSSIFSVCSSLVALEQGEQVHSQALKGGFLSDVVVGTALVDMYNKCGSVEKATKAFLEMPTRTVVSWTSMITAFAQNGKPQQAIQLFEDMRMAGEKPNKITFVAVLSACSQAGLVDEAFRYFEMMKVEYKIRPVTEHYTCLVDMYARLGRVEDAFDLIKTMDRDPTEFLWLVLMAGCRNHGKLELGFYAAEELLKLKPRDASTYIMILNMYLSAEKWQDVSRIRKVMKEEKVGKLQDWSWVTIKDKVYSFKTGDRVHQSGLEVESYLNTLIEEVKEMGYKPANLTVGNEEEESHSSHLHSEKMAVAFGLLNTPNRAVIRVLKSASICGDSHDFIKLVSKKSDREIVIRDSKRLHRFIDGHCSCGNSTNLI
ncbi:hypothetical protein V2J09_007269 [Rumex salicifolius]